MVNFLSMHTLINWIIVAPNLVECGITIFTPNVRRLGERLNYASAASRILGGYEAWPHSWPSIVLIVFNYRIEIEMPTPNQAFKQPHVVSIVRTFVCAGTLVGRKTGIFLFYIHILFCTFDIKLLRHFKYVNSNMFSMKIVNFKEWLAKSILYVINSINKIKVKWIRLLNDVYTTISTFYESFRFFNI